MQGLGFNLKPCLGELLKRVLNRDLPKPENPKFPSPHPKNDPGFSVYGFGIQGLGSGAFVLWGWKTTVLELGSGGLG